MREAMPTTVVTLVALAIVSIAALAFVAAPERRAQPGTGSPPPAATIHAGDFTQPTVVHDTPHVLGELVFTEEQKDRAVAIARNDHRVRGMLAAHPSEVTDIVLWTGDGAQVVGAAVTMSFSEPTTVTGEWLSFSWSCEQRPLPPPESVPYSATFAGVTSILVFSNLQTNEVDQITPFAQEGVTRVGDQVFTGETKSIRSCYED